MRNKRKKAVVVRKDTSSKARKTAKIKRSKRVKAPKTRNMGQWSEGEFFQRIRSSLRRTFRFWRPMMVALEKASRPYKGPNKRQKKEYKCNHCGNYYIRTAVQIDHVVECGSLNKWEDVVPFIQRMTVEDVDGYQVLCKKCHSIKTKAFKEAKKLEK